MPDPIPSAMPNSIPATKTNPSGQKDLPLPQWMIAPASLTKVPAGAILFADLRCS